MSRAQRTTRPPWERLRRRRAPRGMSLIEVFMALLILAVATLGMVAGMVLAFGSNALAGKRTQMSAFAQGRIERLVTQTRNRICISSTTAPINCSAMTVTGAFDPTVAPGTGGWMLDVIDGTPVVGAGEDAMFGPVAVVGDSGAIDGPRTMALRTQVLAEWNGGTTTGCASTLVANNPAALCREVHIEAFSHVGRVGLPAVPMLRAWVRVVRGGGNWRVGQVVLEEILSQ